MNIRKIGILGLMAVMGVFWSCNFVEAEVETLRAYRAYDYSLGPVDEATVFGTNYTTVHIIAICAKKTGGTYLGTASVTGGGTINFGLTDEGIYPDIRADDGIYTALPFTISQTVAGTDTLLVGDGQSFSVSVDIDGLDGPGRVTLMADYTSPVINSIKENTYGEVKYMDEEVLFNLEADSAGEAAVLLTSSEIQSAEDVVKGTEYIRINGEWRQFEGNSIGGTIDIYVANGSNGTWTSFAITDDYAEKGRTVKDLMDDINRRAFAGSSYGSMTYSTGTDRFTIKAASGYNIGLREDCFEANRVPFFTLAKLFCGYAPLSSSMGGNVYQGKYLVPQTSGTVTCNVVGLFEDNGGNKAINYGTSSRIVLLNGQKKIASENAKILGLRLEPDPSTQVFNAMNKRVTFNMIAGEIDSEIKGAAFDPQNGTIMISSLQINAGDNIIIWNDGLSEKMKHGRVWSITASIDGTVTITNASLRFGEPLSSYGTNTLKKEYFHVAKGILLHRGVPSISFDLGNIENNILLYDDGNDTAHHDRLEGDSIYSGFYELPDGLELLNVPIFAHIKVTNERTVSNDGYPFNDEEKLPFSSSYLVADTKPLNNIYINMDTIKPKVTLLGSTLPFNPEAGKKCEIKYNLTQTLMADVRVVIKNGYQQGANIVKDLGVQTAKTGDNVCYWQGDFENGQLVPDASYYYFIYATDKAGNKSDEVFGVTKVSKVLVDLVEVNVMAAKTITGNAGEGSTYVNIDIDCMLNGNPTQLQNLGFDTDRSTSVWNRPHALFHIAFYDKDSKLVYLAPDDWDNDIDTDAFPNGLPNYVKRGEGTLTYNNNTYLVDECIHLGNPLLLDKFDDNKGNDWDTLEPFHRVSLIDDNEKEYHAKFSCYVDFKSCGVKLNPGTYFVRIYAELMGAWWKFIDHEKSMSGDFIAEKWHCKPDFSHYGLSTEYRDYRFEVVGADLPAVDNNPPDILESSPKAKVKQKDVMSGEENKEQGVWVRVGDQGLGVDFSISKIMLLGPNGLEVSGSPMSNGNDKLYWVIDSARYPEGLSIPGEYTVNITVYDKAKNLTKAVRKFTVIDEMPPEVMVEILPVGDIYAGRKIILMGAVSEYNTGGSEVDQDMSAIILRNDDEQKEIPLSDVQIQAIDKRYESLKVELPNGLPAGAYTVSVIGYDIQGNKYVEKKKFVVLKGISVLFRHPQLGTVTCMNIIPNSRISHNGTSIEIGTNTISVRQLSMVGTFAAGFISFGVPIEILVGGVSIKNCTIDEDVSLRLYYTDAEIQSLKGRIVENELGLHEFTQNEWKQIIGEVVDSMSNQVSYQIMANTPISGSYTISYQTTGDVTLRMEWENDASTIWMIVPGSATANGIAAAGCTRTVTTVTASIPAAPEGYKTLPPVAAFSFNSVANVVFSENVTIKMHYNPSNLPNGVYEKDLIIYGYSGGKWNPLTQNGAAGKIEGGTIILTTNATCQMYAIMYRSPEVIIKEDKATAGFKESTYCYPNPSRGKVTFAYNLVSKSKITIKVYTMLGDIVWEDTHTQESGVDRNRSWNCCNNAGEKIASGVYFYRATMEPEDGSAAATVTKKLIIVQ